MPVPLKGVPGSGDILGAPAAVEFELTIRGTEVTGDAPSQLRGVNVWAPAGVKLHTTGFVTCTLSTLELKGPEACPKKSQASALGSVEASDTIAGEAIKEKGTVQAFFAPKGELIFYANAPSPISAQVYVGGTIHPASPPYAYEFESEIPLVESVPGAAAVSTEAIDLKVGSVVQEARQDRLLHHAAQQVPQGRLPAEGRTEIRERRIGRHRIQSARARKRRSRAVGLRGRGGEQVDRKR